MSRHPAQRNGARFWGKGEGFSCVRNGCGHDSSRVARRESGGQFARTDFWDLSHAVRAPLAEVTLYMGDRNGADTRTG